MIYFLNKETAEHYYLEYDGGYFKWNGEWLTKSQLETHGIYKAVQLNNDEYEYKWIYTEVRNLQYYKDEAVSKYNEWLEGQGYLEDDDDEVKETLLNLQTYMLEAREVDSDFQELYQKITNYEEAQSA